MWGKGDGEEGALSPYLVALDVRFTPTSVGKAPYIPRLPKLGSAVHPHKRGESLRGRFFGLQAEAVHPHKRGESLTVKLESLKSDRFTPTSVGKAVGRTDSQSAKPRFTPTSVGKAVEAYAAAAVLTGSPPQAWGKLTGIRCGRWYRAVHPHKRGESLTNAGVMAELERFTPTSVGKAAIAWVGVTPECGSPPQAWGKRIDYRHSGFVATRFTPTSVGKRERGGPTAPYPAVHPHKRGESDLPIPEWGLNLAVHPHKRGESDLPMPEWGLNLAVHPHKRGESLSVSVIVPPLARFTPTSVGKALGIK
jgi:hypothetical protein